MRRGQTLHIQRIAFIPFNPDDFWYVLKDMGLYGQTVERTGEDEIDPAGYDWRIVGFEAATDEIRSEARQFYLEREADLSSDTDDRCYIKVLYEEKDHFRPLGFRWDPTIKSWWYKCKPEEMYLDILEMYPMLEPQPNPATWNRDQGLDSTGKSPVRWRHRGG